MTAKEQARREILSAWRKLPADQRATENDAIAFAMEKAKEYEHDFPTRGADRYQVIKGWLLREVGRP